MKVILSGNSFKYETEAVLKLFFPVMSFSFVSLQQGCELPQIEDDSVFLCRDVLQEYANLSVSVNICGVSAERDGRIAQDSDDFEHDCEFALCRMLFECLREITGITPEWGVLTGVRPVKLVSRLKRSGMTDEEVANRLKNTCCVSEQKIRLALKTAQTQEPLVRSLPKNSVSLYVSIPFCPSRCAYCSFVSQTVGSFRKLMPEYTDMLCIELERSADMVKRLGLSLDTVYFGGGTPTSLEAEALERIMKKISECFDTSKLREYTVEAGRPDTITAQKLRVIKENGGDRVSVNPQTLNQSVLDIIGRKHTVEQFFEGYSLAKSVGFRAVNVDLIAGLPSDTYEGFCETLENIVSLKPENITVHALSIKRSADMMQGSKEDLSADVASRDIAFSGDFLLREGYLPYYLYRQKNQLGNQENVGWEKGDTQGVYNINMMEEIQTVIACGAGGSTKIVAGEKNIRRLYNPKYPLEYLRHFDDFVLNRKDEAEKMIGEILSEGKELNVRV